MNTLVIQIALLFLPGIIWERIHATYVLKDKPEQFEWVRRSFIFGVLSYAVAFSLYSACHRRFYLVTLEGDHLAFSFRIAREIGAATAVALVMSLAHVWFDSRKLFARFLLSVKIAMRYGPEDVWDYTFTKGDQLSEYLNLRDFDKEIIYSGYVLLYSESEKLRELVLRDVIVYSFDGSELFRAPRVYISRDKDNIDIEFPDRPAPQPPAP